VETPSGLLMSFNDQVGGYLILKSAAAPTFFHHAMDIELGFIKRLAFGDNVDMVFPRDLPEDFRHL